ncbi:MAG TPA: 16S rRNA (adenine(1518)-N(6)/adenine(1519)-N(6))-dimethyltransferase RsmA [Spirochaetota bacterium]|nr:16S rRNA (adenine(1518)-N(6)/adenine(1519)-N(6))-dimethyltransferase RsmA [Spirochaetota bacterium]
MEITARYNLAPNKKLGQNFLVGDNVVSRILELCRPHAGRILEIGPGLGAVSCGLAEMSSAYTAVEIDSGFVRYLSDLFAGNSKVHIIHGDFLKTGVNDEFDLAVSNLPYYCASEILFRLASEFSMPVIFGMVQREMAQRITAAEGSENYGAMTVNLAYYFSTRECFVVPGDAFYPRPEVKSSLIKLERKTRYFPDTKSESLFHDVVKSAFWGRRKTILKTLADSPHMDLGRERAGAILEQCGIDTGARGETLGLSAYIKLTEAIINNEK